MSISALLRTSPCLLQSSGLNCFIPVSLICPGWHPPMKNLSLSYMRVVPRQEHTKTFLVALSTLFKQMESTSTIFFSTWTVSVPMLLVHGYTAETQAPWVPHITPVVCDQLLWTGLLQDACNKGVCRPFCISCWPQKLFSPHSPLHIIFIIQFLESYLLTGTLKYPSPSPSSYDCRFK